MSTARFGALATSTATTVPVIPDSAIEETIASVVDESFRARAVSSSPPTLYIWVYGLDGTKVDVIA